MPMEMASPARLHSSAATPGYPGKEGIAAAGGALKFGKYGILAINFQTSISVVKFVIFPRPCAAIRRELGYDVRPFIIISYWKYHSWT